MSEADNFIPASLLMTPASIAPEWYMLPYYGLVRAIPSKIVGIIAMGIAFTTIANVGDLGYRSQSTSLIYPQATLLILTVDVISLSKVCLLVNTGETIYVLLVASVASIATGTLVSSDTSIAHLTSASRLPATASPHASRTTTAASTTTHSRLASFLPIAHLRQTALVSTAQLLASRTGRTAQSI